jgi:hypothetical protein
MRLPAALLLVLMAGCASRSALPPGSVAGLPDLSCVPFARALSGVALRGDAWTWWAGAAGSYGRARQPVPGAVLVLARSGRLPNGHVAVVLRQIDSRTIMVAHANWGSRGDKGRVESEVPVIDVSPGNDWTMVRVWYAPIGGVGTTSYAAHGFVLPPRAADPAALGAAVAPAARRAAGEA